MRITIHSPIPSVALMQRLFVSSVHPGSCRHAQPLTMKPRHPTRLLFLSLIATGVQIVLPSPSMSQMSANCSQALQFVRLVMSLNPVRAVPIRTRMRFSRCSLMGSRNGIYRIYRHGFSGSTKHLLVIQ